MRIFGTKNTTGGIHLATRVEGTPYPPWVRPLPRGPMVALLHLFLHHTLLLPPTNTIIQLKPESKLILLPFSISLLKAPLTKLLLGDCSLVCDSSIGPISFCSSALFIANLCCLGDHVLELACQIYMVRSSSNA